MAFAAWISVALEEKSGGLRGDVPMGTGTAALGVEILTVGQAEFWRFQCSSQ